MKLSVIDLVKSYGNKNAIDGINLEFENGIYGLLGPNGSGKTTLIRIICDILKPTEGIVKLDGEDVHILDEDYRNILGYLPQKLGYYPNFTAKDYLMYLAQLKGMEKKEAKKRTKEVLEFVSLTEERNHKIKTFSGGMKQRLGIAQALLNDPKVLILDEPTAGLDPTERIRFRNILAQFSKDRIVILSTHIVSDVESVATNIIMLKKGKVALNDTHQTILESIQDKVYTITCPMDQVEVYRNNHIVTGMLPVEAGMQLRIISDTMPCEGAVLIAPNLEDLYLSVFGEEVV
ncbi:MAG: ABC transporter ATP-binding protein [bacterium]|nr:ABC transporter ATP-binding protein [bacterium]